MFIHMGIFIIGRRPQRLQDMIMNQRLFARMTGDSLPEVIWLDYIKARYIMLGTALQKIILNFL